MNRFIKIITIYGLLLSFCSCQNRQDQLTDLQKSEIISAVRTTVEYVFEASNNLDFKAGLANYSNESDAYYVNNGTILSFDELKAAYEQIGPVVEDLNNSIDSWNFNVLSKNSVAITLPIHIKIKLKGIQENNGQLVWTGVVKKFDNKWLIVQSHES